MGSTEPRPDAPWIKRNMHGVVFTDEIVGVDIDLKTEKSVNNLDPIRIESELEEEEFREKTEKSRMKDILLLDQGLEEKL